MQNLDLNGTWSLYYLPNKKLSAAHIDAVGSHELKALDTPCIEATVPGNVELDFMRAGLLPDLFYGENILLAQEYEAHHYWYAKTFDSSHPYTQDDYLIFDGIDTVCEVFLNGVLIGLSDNMLIPQEFLPSSLKEGVNELLVHIFPSVLETRNRDFGAGSSVALPYNYESLMLRKAAYMYGWDICPRIVSGGLWRGVRLERKNSERILEIYPYTENIGENEASIWVYYKIRIEGDDIRSYSLKLAGNCQDSSFERTFPLWHTEGRLNFVIKSPYLWWPRDMGDAALYALSATLMHQNKEIDSENLNFGIRSISLKRTSVTDNDGSGEFCFYINGEKFFARGTNWVPLDAYPSRHGQRLEQALELLYDSNCNIVRCWGGNVYESKAFYDFCDRHGITVWQDFAMGCAIYPQTSEFCDSLAIEVESVVKNLRNHASIILWAGDNECDAAYQWSALRRNPNRNKLTRQVIPDVLEQHDPFRPYLPSSPYIDQYAYEHNLESMIPENHLWGPRDYYKGPFYSNAPAHFASETGYHGCPSPRSVEKFISPDKLWPWKDNAEWILHASSPEISTKAAYAYRIPLMASQVETLFGKTLDKLSAFALASQISQSEAKKFFIERFRMGKWRRTGIIWWNLLDCWPQFSDAVVDYYFTKKLAYHTIKRVSAPVCLMLSEPCSGKITLFGANEFLAPRPVSWQVEDGETGEKLLKGDAILQPNSTAPLGSLDAPNPEAFRFLVVSWTCNGEKGKNHALLGKPPFDLHRTVTCLKNAGLLDLEGF